MELKLSYVKVVKYLLKFGCIETNFNIKYKEIG